MTWRSSTVPEEKGVSIRQLPQALCLEMLQCACLGQEQRGHKVKSVVLQDAAPLRELDQGGAVKLILVGGGRGRGRGRGGALRVERS